MTASEDLKEALLNLADCIESMSGQYSPELLEAITRANEALYETGRHVGFKNKSNYEIQQMESAIHRAENGHFPSDQDWRKLAKRIRDLVPSIVDHERSEFQFIDLTGLGESAEKSAKRSWTWAVTWRLSLFAASVYTVWCLTPKTEIIPRLTELTVVGGCVVLALEKLAPINGPKS